LNLIGRFFADLTNECQREGSLQSLRELVQATEEYRARRNENPK